MALKDWEKVQKLPYLIQWVNKWDTKQVNIIKLKKGYLLDIGKIPSGGIKSQRFKTKAEATKIAEKYMRQY